MRPDTRYVKKGNVHIAYQTLGEGPIDLVMVMGAASDIEMIWEQPEWAAWIEGFADFCRVTLFDQRGTGHSDPVLTTELPALEDLADDVRAVMDAADVRDTAIYAWGHGGPTAILFAASYPDRVNALILDGTYSRWMRDTDYPAGLPTRVRDKYLATIEAAWGTGSSLDLMAPSLAGDPVLRERWAWGERQGGSPGQVVTLNRIWMASDVRQVLDSVHVPTLVIHHSDDQLVRVAHGRHLAAHIPGAKFVELPGADNIVGDAEHVLAEVQEFLTGERTSVEPDRVLATVLFTDIVDSTKRSAELGDRRWQAVLDRQDELVRRQLDRFRGRLIKSTGDGVLATFDGPARAVKCALTITEALRRIGIVVRCGLHTGEIEPRGDDIGGIAVHIASRVLAEAEPGAVMVSGTVRDLAAGAGLVFTDMGTRQLKGLPDASKLYLVSA
ncbi:MAG: alpha/beta fold hydrolase [Candidatus Dormibacteria bacterium]